MEIFGRKQGGNKFGCIKRDPSMPTMKRKDLSKTRQDVDFSLDSPDLSPVHDSSITEEEAKAILDFTAEFKKWTKNAKDLVKLGQEYEDESFINKDFSSWANLLDIIIEYMPEEVFTSESLAAAKALLEPSDS